MRNPIGFHTYWKNFHTDYSASSRSYIRQQLAREKRSERQAVSRERYIQLRTDTIRIIAVGNFHLSFKVQIEPSCVKIGEELCIILRKKLGEKIDFRELTLNS